MALGIYKPGQGYWVRVLSAVGIGALVLATAAWAWGQAVNIQLPARAYTFEVDQNVDHWHTGTGVSLMSTDPADGSEIVIGNAVIESLAPAGSGSLMTLDSLTLSGDLSPAETESISTTDEPPVRVLRYGEIPIVSPLYVQGGIVAVVLVIGMILIFVFVGTQKRAVEFLIATDGEMRKVNWSSRREVMGSTWVVIAAAFLISATLFLIDQVFAFFFRSIDVLN